MQTIKPVARMSMMMNDSNLDMGMKRDPGLQKYQGYSLSTEKVAVESINAGYSSIPSRILGQRGPLGGGSAPTVTPPAQSVADVARQQPEAAGRKLSQSYAQTKVQVKQTPGMTDMNHSVEIINKSLTKASPPVTETPAPDANKKLKNEV